MSQRSDPYLRHPKSTYNTVIAPLGTQLTPREMEVACLLAMGWTCREVGARLGISVKTVDTHRAHLLHRLGLRNNVDLARQALRLGWVTLDPAGERPEPAPVQAVP